MRREANFSGYPAVGQTANEGMKSRPSRSHTQDIRKADRQCLASEQGRAGQKRSQKLARWLICSSFKLVVILK